MSLGKSSLSRAVLNLEKHILKGCLDYATCGDALKDSKMEVGAPFKMPSSLSDSVRVETLPAIT